jgi:hypothetical protein
MNEVTPIVTWSYASDPFKIIYAVRSDGRLLMHTIVKEQDVFAWTWAQTKGLYKDCIVLQENQHDTVYLMVERFLNGRWTKCIERQASRTFTHVEESWAVDCGLSNTVTYPNANLAPQAATGSNVTFIATNNVFAPGDVGSVIRVGGGRAVITAYDSASQVRGTILREIEDVLPENEEGVTLPLLASVGTWTLDAPINTVSGLQHLEGQWRRPYRRSQPRTCLKAA